MQNTEKRFPEIIQSEGDLYLRLVSSDDAENFLRIIIANQDYFSKFDFISPAFTTIDEVERVIKVLIDYKNNLLGANYGLWKQDKLLGLFTINEIAWEKQVADVGFWLIQEASGEGFAYAALCSLMNCCWSSLGMTKLTATTATTNARSQKLLEKSGFIKMETLKDHIKVRNKSIDEYLYQATMQNL